VVGAEAAPAALEEAVELAGRHVDHHAVLERRDRPGQVRAGPRRFDQVAEDARHGARAPPQASRKRAALAASRTTSRATVSRVTGLEPAPKQPQLMLIPRATADPTAIVKITSRADVASAPARSQRRGPARSAAPRTSSTMGSVAASTGASEGKSW